MSENAEIRAHYELEKSLALRLRQASKAERTSLYTEVYDELFSRMPHLKKNANSSSSINYAKWQLRFIQQFLNEETVLLEVGPGNCAFMLEASKCVKKIIAVDVSSEITAGVALPANARLLISDGSSIPVPERSINVVFSNQLMEHLHPEDASVQLKNIWNALTDGGTYICITPNRLGGPYDISRNFDDVATCFHLKEYTNRELAALFRQAGFKKIRARVGAKGIYLHLPIFLIEAFESIFQYLPIRLRQKLAFFKPLQWLLGIKLVAIKKLPA